MEILLSRPFVVALAVLGAALALAATALQRRGIVGERGGYRLNLIGYVCMGISMALFIAAGLRGGS